MATITDFELVDYDEVRAIVASLTPSVMSAAGAGSRWLGFFEPNETLPVEPEPSPDPANPTCWGRWRLEHEEVSPNGDNLVAADRSGEVLFVIRYQIGVSQRVALVIAKRIREAFAAANDAAATGLTYLVEQPTTDFDYEQGWSRITLPIRFRGGA